MRSAGAQAELEEIVDRVTTNETYFFRESYQLDAFRDEILPEIYAQAPARQAPQRLVGRLRLGRRGLHHRHPDPGDGAVRRLGRARLRQRHLAPLPAGGARGAYGRNSFRATDERLQRRYFREVDGKQQVRDEVRALVSFGQINLIDEPMMRLVGDVDVIFCRNVLIYFDTASRKTVIATLHGKLVKGGYLLLGHSESLINLSTAFELVHLKNDMVYRKPRPWITPSPSASW